jgi:hypothetical protein
MNGKEGTLGGIGIGAAIVVAFGAVSLLVKAGWSGFGHPRLLPGEDPGKRPPAVRQQPAPLPEDFDELCRTAGI